MSSPNENVVLSAVGTRTVLNLVCKVFFRLLHFLLNGLVLRHVDVKLIGIANVRLQLLYTTILFLSREAFRRTIPKRHQLDSIPHYINLIWLILPTGLAIIAVALPFTLFVQTDGAEHSPFYHQACLFYALAALIELLSEPFFLLASVTLNYQLNIYIEMFASTVGFTLQALFIYWNSQSALFYYGLGYVFYSLLIATSYLVYFLTRNVADRRRIFLVSSLREFLLRPTSPFVDEKLSHETLTFFKQGIWMKFLTEGERYVMSLFNLVSYKDQGIYDVINNLGSLLPRLVFSTLEESAYTYFQQTLTRTRTDQEQTVTLNALNFFSYILRFVMILSLLVMGFGIPYAELALRIYGGTNLADGPGPSLLRFYCVYLFFLAMNGITEAFGQATMSIKQLERFKYFISIFTVIYFFLFYVLIRSIGIHGILIANCLNMTVRIVINGTYLYRYFPKYQWSRLISFSPMYLIGLLSCSTICWWAEQWLNNAFLHFSLGFVLGVSMLLFTWREEREMIHYIYCIWRLNRPKKSQ